MGYRVLIPEDISAPGKDYLRQRGYEIRMGTGLQESDILRDIQGCDAVLVRNQPVTRAILEAEPRLRVVAKHGVGLDKIDLASAAQLGIWVVYGPYSNTLAVAEHTIALIMACAKKLVFFDQALRQGHYEIRNQVRGSEVEGAVLGILGAGRIGSLVAQKAQAGLGMKALLYDPFIPASRRNPQFSYTEELEALFQRADYISIHMPSTDATQHMVGRALLGAMKPTAYLINTARGDILCQEDLYWALREKRIAGAALDVFDPEPPLSGSPLFQLDNLVCTPHNAALTRESTDRMGLQAAQGIHEVLSGLAPTWPAVTPSNP